MGIITCIYFGTGLLLVALLDLSDALYPDQNPLDNWDRFFNLILWPLTIFIFVRALIRKFLGE
jgi:hypothetical protein